MKTAWPFAAAFTEGKIKHALTKGECVFLKGKGRLFLRFDGTGRAPLTQNLDGGEARQLVLFISVQSLAENSSIFSSIRFLSFLN